MQALAAEEIELFWSRVVVDCASDCWVWTHSRHPRGYGLFSINGRSKFAHRVAYATWRGDPGGELDHLCRFTACCNPWHLEAVSHRENVLRGVSPVALNAQKTHCKHGHEFTPENTYVFTGRGKVERNCRACGSKHKRAYKKSCKIGPALGKCAG